MTSSGTITPCYTVSFQRRTTHPAPRLWAAITNAEEVARWMGYPARVDLRVGGEWQVDFASTGGGEMSCVIVRVEPERVLTYVWGWSVIEWTLEETAEGCAYRFVQAGLADRGADEEGLPAGWHEFIDHLEHHLNGVYLTHDERTANWEQLKPHYRERLDRALPGRLPVA